MSRKSQPLGISGSTVKIIREYEDRIAALDKSHNSESASKINLMPLALAAESMARNGESLSAGERIKDAASEARRDAPGYITQELLLDFAGAVVEAHQAASKGAQR